MKGNKMPKSHTPGEPWKVRAEIPDTIYKPLKILSIQLGANMTEAINHVLQDWLDSRKDGES